MIDHTLRLVLDSLGHSEEYEYYLKKFQSEGSGCFALFCPDAESLHEEPERLLSALHFLQKLELYGAIVFCSPQAPPLVNRLLEYDQGKCLEALPVKTLEPTLIKSVQKITQDRRMPLLYSDSIFLQEALLFYAKEIARRLHFLRIRGPLQKTDGETLLYANHSLSLSELCAKDRPLFCFGRALLLEQPKVHISISSSFHLLKEIFTVKGAGTILRLQKKIYRSNPKSISQDKLLSLLRGSFSRPLKKDFHLGKTHVVYHDEDFQGAIFLEIHGLGFYMSKFSVDSQARGLGIGQDLWETMLQDTPALFWRSRAKNSINRWYARLADGMQKVSINASDWKVFWKGIATESIPQAIRFCIERPDDFL